MNKLLTTAAMVGIIAAAATAQAADAPKVKCYGIAKAGKNDCKAANGSHSCAGQAKADNDANDFKNTASADECTKAGGKTEAPKAAAPAAKKNPAATPAPMGGGAGAPNPTKR